jgi:hypothetical protein
VDNCGRLARWGAAFLLLAGLAVGGTARPAAAAPVAGCADAAVTRASATALAARCHSRVEDLSARTPTGQQFANPDGSHTSVESAVPVRVKRADGSWVPVDLTLRGTAPNGTVSPAASPTPVTLSGGGTGPLATVYAGSERFSLSWPAILPAPTLSGDTATYAEVLPGVDLRVRVDRYGFSEVLVVRSADAARNPALAKVRFATSGPAGAAFRIGAPLMWDSTPATGADPGTGDAPDSDVSGPGRSARRAPMAMQVSGSDLVVVPDPALLAAPDVRYPLYLDPSVSVGGTWTMINSTFPDQSYWSYDRASHAKVGFTNDPQNMVYRSIWQFDTGNWRGRHVLGATFSADLLHSWSCSNSTTELHLTGAVNSGTTWNNNAGTWGSSLANISNSSCNDVRKYTEWGGGALVNVVQQSTGWPTITLGLRAADEGSTNGWKKFDENSARLSVTYNSVPNVPDQLTIDGKPCGTGANKAYVSTLGGHNPVLSARVSDPDSGDHLNGNFSWSTASGTATGSQTNVANGATAQVTTNGTAFTPGTTYSFSATAWDGTDTSGTAGPCEFVADNAAPGTGPTVASADGRYALPLCDGHAAWCDGLGRSGSFTFGPNGVTDVAYYLYGLVDPPSTVATAAVDGTATGSATPNHAGINDLYVRSVDRAGNPGPVTDYRFYVASGSDPRDVYTMSGNGGTTLADTGNPGGHPATLSGNASVGNGVASFNGTGTVPLGAAGVTSAVSGTGGRCMDISNSQNANGARIWLWDCHGLWNQLWRPQPNGSLLNPQSGRCLDINGYGTANGTIIQLWDCTGNWNQVWQPTADGALRNPQSGRCLDASGYGTANGTYLLLWDCTGNWNQVWQPQPNGAFVSPQAGRCLDVFNGNTANGTKVETWNCNGGGAQQWVPQPNGSLVNPQSGRCLDVSAYGTANGSLVQLWDCTGATNQVWVPQPDGSLKNPVSGRCLEPGSAPGNGAQLQLYDCNGGLTQKWTDSLTSASAATTGAVVNTTTSFSVAAWVKLTSTMGSAVAVSQDGTRTSGFTLGYDAATGRWAAGLAGSDVDSPTWTLALSGARAQANVWTHLVLVYDAGAHQVVLYVNGVAATPAAITMGWNATGALAIGRGRTAGVAARYWSGGVDDVRVYDRLISSTEVGTILSESAMAGLWALDDGTGATVAADSSGAGLDATLNGTVGWTAGHDPFDPFDRALHLGGSPACATTSGPALRTDQAYTVAVWVKLSSTTGWQMAVSQDGNRGSGFGLGYDSTAGRWAADLPLSDADGSASTHLVSTSVPQVGVWTHLALVNDVVAHQLRLYVNGQQEATFTTAPTWNASGAFAIGRGKLNGAANNYWTGDLDDVYVFTGVKTQADIQDLIAST